DLSGREPRRRPRARPRQPPAAIRDGITGPAPPGYPGPFRCGGPRSSGAVRHLRAPVVLLDTSDPHGSRTGVDLDLALGSLLSTTGDRRVLGPVTGEFNRQTRGRPGRRAAGELAFDDAVLERVVGHED